MKNQYLEKKLNSNLSCILKCLRITPMKYKKIILGISIFCFLGACTSPTAMLGPAYTLTSTGNVFQAGFSYGSSEMITMYTGKTPMENIVEFTSPDRNNIHKKTLESKDFQDLVKKRVKITNNILKSSNQ
tara:strand:+ start:161 stop:550 length:390 start_codon:yes stop_codon:yes gene_type:complete